MPVPSQPPNGSAALNDVSCSTAIACTAVGSTHVPGAGDDPLALRTVDGTTWNPSSPVAAAHTMLRSVSCSSSTECTAVGDEFVGTTGDHARAAGVRTTNGTTWTSLGPTFTRPEYVTNAVSCPAPTRCVAVGIFATTNPPGGKSLVLRED